MNETTLSELLELFNERNFIKNQEMCYIQLFDDGTGDIVVPIYEENKEDDIIDSFSNLSELITKLQNDLD